MLGLTQKDGTGMFVCTCHGVRRREVQSAIETGARTPREALARCGQSPQCGRCLREIMGYIRATRRDSAVAAE